MMRGPKNWSKTPPRIRRPAPRLSENSAEVLTEIGYPEQEARKIAGCMSSCPGLEGISRGIGNR